MIIAGTGHRPDKLGGYDFNNPQRVWIRQVLRYKLIGYRPTRGISGMALGFDQDLALVFIELAIPFTAAIPFVGQEDAWPEESRKTFDWLLERADDVVIVSPGSYAAWKMQVRNEWMVDNCDRLFVCWDGSSGGTANCFKYAQKVGREFDRIEPQDFYR